VPVIDRRRNVISVSGRSDAELLAGAGGETFAVGPELDVDAELEVYRSQYGAEIVEDFQYDLEVEEQPLPVEPDVPDSPGLDDVVDAVNARGAWQQARGAGTVIAIVDTGVDGRHPEFPLAKRRGQWAPIGEDAWTDDRGHGTMCACIATALRVGDFEGIAPDAGLISCRTHLTDSELALVYDYLGDFAAQNSVRLVASNSFGIKSGQPPPEDQNSDFIPALSEALDKGVIPIFSAGNYHELAGGQANDCAPNSIWTYKTSTEVLTVATATMDGQMWSYSSRGPGQFPGRAGTNDKPDVTAPTPENGRILYGDGPRTLPNGWGTSGACPQVAGLAALLLSMRSDLARDDVFAAIRDSARPLGHGRTCEGTGQIDCAGAMTKV
jgi:serine protease AprX